MLPDDANNFLREFFIDRRCRCTKTLYVTHNVYVMYGGRWWRWALVSPDGVAPSRMVSVSVSVNLPFHHKVQKFCSVTGSPGWSRKKGCKAVV